MRINLKKGYLVIMVIVSVLILSACQNKKTIHLDNLNKFENIFEDIYLMEIGQKDEGFTYLYDEDTQNMIELLKTLEVEEEIEDADDIFRVRNEETYIFMRKKDGGYVKIFVENNFETIWMLTGDTYTYWGVIGEEIESHSYNVSNKDVLEIIFKPLEGYDEEVYKAKFLDVRVMEVQEEELIVREERLNKDWYYLDEWLNELGDTYTISLNELQCGIDKFRKGDKLRIEKESIDKDKAIHGISNLYYLNEMINIKGSIQSKYFTEEQVDAAIDDFARHSLSDVRTKNSINYYYCDDEKFAYIHDTEDIFKENPKDLENTLMIFVDVLSSRGMQGEMADRMLSEEEYGLGGWSTYSRTEVEKMIKIQK